MSAEFDAADLAGAARVAGCNVSGLDLKQAAAQLRGLLAALRALPVERDVEPLPHEKGVSDE